MRVLLFLMFLSGPVMADIAGPIRVIDGDTLMRQKKVKAVRPTAADQ